MGSDNEHLSSPKEDNKTEVNHVADRLRKLESLLLGNGATEGLVQAVSIIRSEISAMHVEIKTVMEMLQDAKNQEMEKKRIVDEWWNRVSGTFVGHGSWAALAFFVGTIASENVKRIIAWILEGLKT